MPSQSNRSILIVIVVVIILVAAYNRWVKPAVDRSVEQRTQYELQKNQAKSDQMVRDILQLENRLRLEGNPDADLSKPPTKAEEAYILQRLKEDLDRYSQEEQTSGLSVVNPELVESELYLDGRNPDNWTRFGSSEKR